MASADQKLTFGELQLIDSIISLAQENGVELGDAVKAQSQVCCCGATAAEAKGRFAYSARDREIIARIAELEAQIESSPTLGQLIEARGELLRDAKASQ